MIRPVPFLLIAFAAVVTGAPLDGSGLGASARPPAQQVHPATDTSWIPHVRADTLPNGMTVLAVRRGSAPVAAFVVEYRVGGVNDPDGGTGVAHLLEHLLFKGTRELGTTDWARESLLLARMDSLAGAEQGKGPPAASVMEEIRALEDSARSFSVPNEFDGILTRNGARGLNAITTAETTTYFVELPSNRAELWFALEAHRMSDPVLREFYTERDVVLEERALRVGTSPAGQLQEAHLALAFPSHPFGRPVVGYDTDLEALTRPVVREFHSRHYGARNAVVTVVGDIHPDSGVAWAARYLGSVPAGEAPPPVPAVPAPARGERRTELVLDAQPALRMGWRVPDGMHDDAPALAMLSVLLTGSRTSRLHRALVGDDRTAISVSSSTEPGVLYPGLFVISATPRSPATVAHLEAGIQRQLAVLADRPPARAELERVRIQLEASRIRRLRTNLGLALRLSDAQTLWSSWRAGLAFPERMAEVTPERITEVVRRYFQPDNRTVASIRRREGS
jgi:predicted Zn-dependent peptidase